MSPYLRPVGPVRRRVTLPPSLAAIALLLGILTVILWVLS